MKRSLYTAHRIPKEKNIQSTLSWIRLLWYRFKLNSGIIMLEDWECYVLCTYVLGGIYTKHHRLHSHPNKCSII